MAAIDKLYGTYDQWCDLHSWVARSKRPQYCRYFYPTPPYKEGDKDTHPLTNTPIRVDIYWFHNCPLKWVKKQLKDKYRKGYLEARKS